MRLASGARVGPYEVLALLGSGGMAEVYRARDTRLGRDVALKVVNEALGASPDFIRRFEQEARLAGSLSHPNVAAVYDFGVHEAAPYFVTELLKGETLRTRLERGPIAIPTALDWSAQIARGLAAAHAQGVIHRDVKPDNVFLTSDGQLKLLDFGIAKSAGAMSEASPHNWMDATVTPTGGLTRTGSVLGTPGYMSPEQVRGEPLDARSDVFSWGATVYEMLSGRRAFQGSTVVETGYAVLHREPEPLPSSVPPALAELVLHCLEKEPSKRVQTADDLAFAVGLLRNTSGIPVTARAVRPGQTRGRRLLGGGLILALVSAIAVVAMVRPHAALAPASAPQLEQVTFRWGAVTAGRFLSDGRIAFSAAFDDSPEELYVLPRRSATPQLLGIRDARLLGVLGGELGILLHPRYSNVLTSHGTIARVPSVGGSPRELVENAEFADWSSRGALATVTVGEGARTLESPPGKVLFRTTGYITNPRFSAAGTRIAFLHHPVFGDDMGEVVTVDLDGRARILTRRMPSTFGLAWAPDDSAVWFTGGTRRDTLRAARLDGGEDVLYQSPSTIRLEDVSRAGEVLLSSHLEREEAVYVGPDGKQLLLSWTDWNAGPAAVSDAGKVLFAASDEFPSEGGELFQAVLRGSDGSAAQLLGYGYPLDLSKDGRWALIESEDLKSLTILPTGAGQPRNVQTGGLAVRAGRWMPDGRRILVTGRLSSDEATRLYFLPEGSGEPQPVGRVRLGGRRILHVSPDGRWAATVDVHYEAVVLSLSTGELLPLPSALKGTMPRGWSTDGSLWVSEAGDHAPAQFRLLRMDLRTGGVLEERKLGPTDPAGALNMTHVVLSPNGRHVAFVYDRAVGSLFVVRGLWKANQ